MKKLIFFTHFTLLLVFLGQSQTIPPPYINYQAVLYDVNGASPNLPLTNQSFSTFVNINDELGNLLYKEEHYASTDANGQITVKIGDGVYLQGTITNFNQINWGTGKYYLIVDFDINGTISSTAPEQLVTVPYSFYAGKAGNGMTAVADNGNGTLTFTYANGQTYITPTLASIQGPVGPAGAVGPQGSQGLTGSPGVSGVNGANGTAVLNGTNNPTSGVGIDGDFYINTANNTLFGPKTSGAWSTGVSLVGPAGIDGAAGVAGSQGLTGLTGANGLAGAVGATGSVGPAGQSAGTVLYIYNDQTCPTGWTKQEINVGIFGGASVDACWTTNPCMVMYIYNDQTCPAGWTSVNIGVAIFNGSTTPVDACIKCN